MYALSYLMVGPVPRPDADHPSEANLTSIGSPTVCSRSRRKSPKRDHSRLINTPTQTLHSATPTIISSRLTKAEKWASDDKQCERWEDQTTTLVRARRMSDCCLFPDGSVWGVTNRHDKGTTESQKAAVAPTMSSVRSEGYSMPWISCNVSHPPYVRTDPNTLPLVFFLPARAAPARPANCLIPCAAARHHAYARPRKKHVLSDAWRLLPR